MILQKNNLLWQRVNYSMNVSSHPMCKSFNPNTSQRTKFVLIYDLIPCRHRRWLFLAFEAKTWIEWKIRGFRMVFSSALGFGVKWLFRGIFNECQISMTITTARGILIHTKNSIVIKFKQHSTIPYGYFQYNKPFFTWGFFFLFLRFTAWMASTKSSIAQLRKQLLSLKLHWWKLFSRKLQFNDLQNVCRNSHQNNANQLGSVIRLLGHAVCNIIFNFYR